METRRATGEMERLERRLGQRWRDLALAEQRGQPTRVLERMYAAYVRELEVYVRLQRAQTGHEPRSRLAS
jgi:hypothetical protein